MAESQIIIRVERELLKRFKAQCVLHDTTATAQVANFVMQRLAAWERADQRSTADHAAAPQKGDVCSNHSSSS
jgi:hypothetical protein